MDRQERKINKLQTVLELTKLLNSSNDVNYILKSMMNSTLEILERADIGAIFLYDRDQDYLILKTSVGFNDMEFKFRPGEGIAGFTFNNKKTLHLKNHQEIIRLINLMDKHKRDNLNMKIAKPLNNLQSSISCPLIDNGECIGVLVIDNYYGKEPLNEYDVYLTELVSIHAAIAIVNASNYEKIIENQNNLENYSRIIAEEKERYKYSTYLHNKFTEMVLKGSSIGDIVKEVSSMLKRDVFTIDLFYVIQNYSVGYQTNIEILNREKSRLTPKLKYKRESIFYCNSIERWMYFNPIRVHKEVLGWVGIVSNSSTFTELEKISIDKCLTIIALEILKNNELSNMEQSLKGDFFDNLLTERSTEFMSKFAKKYNYNFNGIHQILIIKIDYKKIETLLHKNLKYLYIKINQLMQSTFKSSITLQKQNYIITIFERDKYIAKENLILLIEQIFEKCRFVLSRFKIDFDITIVVSESIKNSSDFRIIYENTMKIFNLHLLKNGKFNYYFYEDLEVKRFLLKNDKKELEKFVDKILGPLIAYNNSSRKDLYDTLRVYIRAGGNWTLTKNLLHIHGNTLTYRLNRLKEILELDLSDYNNRLKVEIALEIIDINL